MITPWLLLLVPWAVLVLVQLLSLVALARELPGRPRTGASTVATVGFAVAAVAVAVALGWRCGPAGVPAWSPWSGCSQPRVHRWPGVGSPASCGPATTWCARRSCWSAPCSTSGMSLPIGEVVRRSGLSHDTVRYYERIGLLPLPGRDLGNRRRYDEHVLPLLAVVRVLREAGFTLAQVRSVLGTKTPGSSARQRVAAMRAVIAGLERDLDGRRAAVQRAQGVLEELRAELDAGEPYTDEALDC